MTQQQKLEFKNNLKVTCQLIIEQRIEASKAAICQAQQSANQEEKSSAGDKYETSRAMGHLEKDMHSRQLGAHLKELSALHAVNTNHIYTKPVAGSFIQCSQVSFFIACGLGKQSIEGTTIIFLSPHAPLAQSLFSKKVNDNIAFNGTDNLIVDVY